MIEVYEAYSPLDALGRCGAASACLGPEILPPEGERRAEISHVHPSGWHVTCYGQDLVPGESLYNRTHLIARSLCGNGDVPQNLITGTQHLNQSTMQPLENRVMDYIRESGNHVLYRVTPEFEGEELVARGLRMEARSIEDGGAGISLNMYCYNVQPGVTIDYATGSSHPVDVPSYATLSMKGYLLDSPPPPDVDEDRTSYESPPPYILNFAKQRFHLRSCKCAEDIVVRNEGLCRLDRRILLELGYTPCGYCNP